MENYLNKNFDHIIMIDETHIMIHEDIFILSEFAYIDITSEKLAKIISDFNEKNMEKYHFDTEPKIIFQDLKSEIKNYLN